MITSGSKMIRFTGVGLPLGVPQFLQVFTERIQASILCFLPYVAR